jgi:predicted kinase
MSDRPILVIVSGAPGAGKTTLARTIATRRSVPLLEKDALKESIGDGLGAPSDVAASQRIGIAAYRILFDVAARILQAGAGVIVESNFRRGQSEPELRRLVELADARLVHCTAEPATLRARYAARFERGDRHPVHLDAHRAAALAEDLAIGRFEPLDLPIPTIIVATEDGYEPDLAQILAFAAGGSSARQLVGAGR